MFESFINIGLVIFLAILWTIDLVETITLVHKKGTCVEANPFAKFLLKHSNKDFIMFKTLDFFFIVAILKFVSVSYMFLAETLLVLFICLYILVVIHNRNVMKFYGCKI